MHRGSELHQGQCLSGPNQRRPEGGRMVPGQHTNGTSLKCRNLNYSKSMFCQCDLCVFFSAFGIFAYYLFF